jgi:hypothetical protein
VDFLDDAFTRRRVDPVLAGDRIDPRHASGRPRAARCWSSPRVAHLQSWLPCGRWSSATSRRRSARSYSVCTAFPAAVRLRAAALLASSGIA